MDISALYETYFDASVYMKPYPSNREYLEDRMRFLTVCMTVACAAKGLEGGEIPEPETVGSFPGLSVSSTDLFGILTPDNENTCWLTETAREQIENAYFHVECRARQTLRTDVTIPMEALALKCKLDEFEKFALLMAFSTVWDRKFEGAYAYLHNSAGEVQPTRWLAVRLFTFLFGMVPDSAAALLDGTSPVAELFTAAPDVSDSRNAAAEKLLLRGRVASWLMGMEKNGVQPDGYVDFPETADKGYPDIPVWEKQRSFCQKFFRKYALQKNDECAVLNIYGPEGIGRRYIAAKAAEQYGMRIMTADIRRIVLLGDKNVREFLDQVYLETLLTGAVPCFLCQKEEISEDEEKKQMKDPAETRLEFAAEYIAQRFSFVFWITPERDSIFLGTKTLYAAVEMPMLTAEERKLFWNAWVEQELLAADIDPDVCASQYILSPRDLKKVIRTAKDQAVFCDSLITRDILKESIRQHAKNQLGLYATLINAVFTWDDLVVSEDQKRKMKMICDQVRYRRIVGEEWGFRKKSPYGNGLCALFYGSPGTGKTMAVQVMANELGIDLYRIDLSQLVSKYIGETQKNISELFAKAKNINAMLFFDEADAMFAKRSEVKDSNDRYANADTAFLLQKLEDYEGITILATNYVNNIDDAFKRRIKFMVNFVFPDPDVRLMLWRKIAPRTARYDEEIDFEFFAEHFELTGSSIKEILTNAAYIAAAEGGGLRNRHVIEAVKLNFSKYGKLLTDEDFGYLGG